jgi:hypothetical protein
MGFAKFEPDVSDFTKIALTYHGNIQAIARHYNVCKESVYQCMYRNPLYKRVIDAVRSYTHETILDLAEHVHITNMNNLDKNPALAQRAAEKVLDLKGSSRGYTGKQREDDSNKIALEEKFNVIMDHFKPSSDSQRNMQDNNVNIDK